MVVDRVSVTRSHLNNVGPLKNLKLLIKSIQLLLGIIFDLDLTWL